MLELEVKRLGVNGEGIAYYNKKVVFVDNALPGERVKIDIEEETDKFIKGKLVEILIKSKNRVEPFCKKYNDCGGCQLQHLSYQGQLEIKREQIIEAITKYTNINPRKFEIKKTLGMDNPYNYRNKASLPLRTFQGKTLWGMYRVNTNQLIALSDCAVQYKDINTCANKITELMDKLGFEPFNKNHGLIKYIVIRQSSYTLEMQVTLILAETKTDVTPLVNEIKKIENVASVYTDINKGESNDIFGSKLKKHVGEDTILDKLGVYQFNLLPNAFFQLNPKQTSILYDEIKKAAKLSLKEKVVDLYCGVGTISIWVSKLAKEVIGIESNKEAIKSANENIEINKIKNVKFICGDALTEIKKIKDIDVVLVDPPRTGLKQLANDLLTISPKRIVYTSCNPSTFAKDLNVLSEKYEIKYIQPVDMFPFTSRVESVCCLSLKNDFKNKSTK